MIETIKGMIVVDHGFHHRARARVKRLEFDIGVAIASWGQSIKNL